MIEQGIEDNSYRIEISGWDISENFFVEKAALKWNADGAKEVCVNSSIRQGSIVFIRLLQPLASENNYPIAYQASNVGPRDARGLVRVGLDQLRPRQSAREEFVAANLYESTCVLSLRFRTCSALKFYRLNLDCIVPRFILKPRIPVRDQFRSPFAPCQSPSGCRS